MNWFWGSAILGVDGMPLDHGTSMEYEAARTFCLWFTSWTPKDVTHSRWAGWRGIADDSGPTERRPEGYKNRTWLGRGLAWLCLYCTASTHSFGPRAQMHQAGRHCPSRVTYCIVLQLYNGDCRGLFKTALCVPRHVLSAHTCFKCLAAAKCSLLLFSSPKWQNCCWF